MKNVTGGTSDHSTVIRFIDSTDGFTPETGVTSATAGLALWYRREGGLKVAISSISDLAALDSAHSDGGLLHISDGYYRLDVPDAAFAASASGVLIGGSATGMIVQGSYHQIDSPVVLGNTAMGGTSLVLALGQLVINSTSADGAVDIDCAGGPAVSLTSDEFTTAALYINNTVGDGIMVTSAATGMVISGAAGSGLQLSGTGQGLYCLGNVNGNGVTIVGNGTGAGVRAMAFGTGKGAHVTGGFSGGAGMLVAALSGDTDAVNLTPSGSGSGLNSGSIDDATLLSIAGSILATATNKLTTDSAGAVTVSPDLYDFDWNWTRDQTNARDEITGTWRKNLVKVSTAVTDATCEAIKRADGTDLVPLTTMTQITGPHFKLDVTDQVKRMTKGEANYYEFTATIDGSTRTWGGWRSRDT